MKSNGHTDACLCDWCGAILNAQRKRRWDNRWAAKPSPPPPKREPVHVPGCWFCEGGKRVGGLCFTCKIDLQLFQAWINRTFD